MERQTPAQWGGREWVAGGGAGRGGGGWGGGGREREQEREVGVGWWGWGERERARLQEFIPTMPASRTTAKAGDRSAASATAPAGSTAC
jgi:hypothetical protein